MLLVERVASLSCRSSQLGSWVPAVTTASGLFPRLPSLRVWVGATNSSTGSHLSCRRGECIYLRALLLRQLGGCRIEHGPQADNPEPRRQGNAEPLQRRNHGGSLLLWLVAIPCFWSLAELIRIGGGIDQDHARHLLGIPVGVGLHGDAA